MLQWTWEYKYLFETQLSILLCLYPEGEFLANMVILFLIFFSFRAVVMAYGSSQPRGWIGAAAAGLHRSHSNTGCGFTSVIYTTACSSGRSLIYWMRLWIEPTSSQTSYRFLTHWTHWTTTFNGKLYICMYTHTYTHTHAYLYTQHSFRGLLMIWLYPVLLSSLLECPMLVYEILGVEGDSSFSEILLKAI